MINPSPDQEPLAPVPEPIKYIEDEPGMPRLHNVAKSIANNSCVLILGPLFGRDAQGRNLSVKLQSNILRSGMQIDTNFQNLFIMKDESNNGYDLMNQIRNFYTETLAVDEAYKDIARVKFPAIVSFTHDSYLPQSFIELGYDFQFNYYTEGASGKFNNGLKENSLLAPLIYNIYGIYTDNNSVITTYSNFYNFVFSILGNDGFLPQDLKLRIAKAECFLFLGFDWKDPYIPLLISKIFRIAKGNVANATAIATLNNTDTSNTAYTSWLERYPLKLNMVRDSHWLIDLLTDTLSSQYRILKPPPPPGSKVAATTIDIPADMRDRWKRDVSNSDDTQIMKEVCDEVVAWASGKNADLENNFINLSAQCSVLLKEIAVSTITTNEAVARLNVIRKGVLTLINPVK